SNIVQSLFSILTDNIFFIIYAFAAVEIYLVGSIFFMLKSHESKLLDVADNLLKGFSDAPDRDSSQNAHEKIQAALQYINTKIATDFNFKLAFRKNAQKVNERQFYNRHYKIEMFASVMSTLVQIFPLLGILGTILAIAQTAFQSGAQIDVTSLSSAFVLAMDTTILGITFSILFMVIESAFSPKIERVIVESEEYRRILSNIYLDNEKATLEQAQ
ncbi:MAG: MotA/TolQ/ExbB proton channel family protein, partial [Bacteriovoracaceae bacterium]|nr:MotA/TolQ/ExbB proton channel family protein [Bacteriovoracaceae bacterium]